MTASSDPNELWQQFQQTVALMGDEPLPGLAIGSPDGFLTRVDRWGIEHPGAALEMTKSAVAALDLPPSRGPLALVDTIRETQEGLLAAESEGPDRILRLLAPRVVSSLEGASRWTLLTMMSDRVASVRVLLGTGPANPHYRRTPPPLNLRLTETEHPEQLAQTLGVPLRSLLDACENDDPVATARGLFSPLAERIMTLDPSIGAALRWLVDHDASALMSLPMTQPIRAAMSGAQSSEPVAAQLAHVIELGPLGYGLFVWWDDGIGANRAMRAHLAGYIRYLYDHYVAPWNRWAGQTRRREALCVYAALAGDRRLDASRLAKALRGSYPAEYRSEPLEQTIRRLYRQSTELRDIYVPAALRAALRGSELLESNGVRS